MHFGRIKALYALAVLALVVILLFADGLARGIAAVFLLIGAISIWRAIKHSAFNQGLDSSEHTLDLLIANLTENDDHQARQ